MSAHLNAGQPEALEMEIETSRFSKPLVTAFSVSLGIHLLLLCGLALVKFSVKLQEFTEVTSSLEEEQDPTALKFDATMTDQVGGDTNVSSLASSQEAANSLARNPQEEVERTISDNLQVATPVTDEIVKPSKTDVLASVATQGATEHSGGVEGAVDRLTWEIATSLRDKKTLVVWLFDVSPSLAARRAMIADRIENVYGQLTSLNVANEKVLKTAIVTFGEKTSILTKDPLDEPADVVKLVRNIKSESSGNENTFAAVTTVAKHYQNYRTQMHRDVMIIIVTDEAGSDPENLEQAIVNTKRYGMRCYCVGDAAPFGKQKTEVPFTLESGETVIGIMDRGPETLYPERLALPYWGSNSYDIDNMSSGMGPYGLTRLCAETNGLYFITDEGRGSIKLDPQVMRNYAPDYRPIKMIKADIDQNKAKSALFEVCRLLTLERVPLPRLEFPAENDTVLRVAIGEAQRPLADFEYKLDALVRVLEPGEKDRAKIKDARSRAGYDLAMGRVLALRARSFGYNAMLAEMKSSPKKFEKPGSNQWQLKDSKEITSGAATKKLATRALEYLRRVIDEHPGTPWQYMAERELSTQLGWEWKESTYNPNPVNMGAGKEKAGPKFIEVEDPVTKKKVKKMIDKDPVRRDI